MENWLVSRLLTNSENLLEGIVLSCSGHYYVHGRKNGRLAPGRFRREKQQVVGTVSC